MEKRKSTSKSLRVYAASFGVLSLVLLWLAMGASSEEGRLVGAYGFPETPPLSRLSSLNLVQNGGFENDFNGWQIFAVDSSLLMISSTTVHSGAKALEVLGSDTTAAWVQQVVNVPFDSTEISFWVYPASTPYRGWFTWVGFELDGMGRHQTLLIPQDGSLFIESMRTRNDGTVDRVNATIANVLLSNSWNKVVVQVMGAGQPHQIFVNDNLVGSLTAPYTFAPIDHIGFGDAGTAIYYGTMYFDDISITGTLINSPPWARLDEVVYNTSTDAEEVAGDPGKLIDVLANDFDPNQDSLWVTSITQPMDGIAAFDTTFPGFSITPNRLFYRLTNTSNHAPTDQLQYTITDGVFDSTTTVTILFDEACALVPMA
ncbi:Ig-like domain-containing protein, partial [bacterium]|nr:Ig-like domain-containing protein [bacterium]